MRRYHESIERYFSIGRLISSKRWISMLQATILRGRAALTRADMAKLKKLVKNDELVEFMREFTSEDGLSQARVERATSWTDRVLGELDERLEEHQWLAGDAFSLADLVWSIDIHRFELINLPMEKYRSMLSWYRRIETSSGFQRMVLDYESQFKESMEAQRSEP